MFLYLIHHKIIIKQLNLFASAIGSKTVIFFLSIVSNPESFKSPNNLVIVTLVESIKPFCKSYWVKYCNLFSFNIE